MILDFIAGQDFNKEDLFFPVCADEKGCVVRACHTVLNPLNILGVAQSTAKKGDIVKVKV